MANLVAKTFGSSSSTAANIGKRIDTPASATIPPFSDTTPVPGILSHLLQIIGLDGGKIGAMAVNGIIFIAQLVRTGFAQFGTYFKQHLWDWSVIIDYIVQRVKEANQGASVSTVGV